MSKNRNRQSGRLRCISLLTTLALAGGETGGIILAPMSAYAAADEGEVSEDTFFSPGDEQSVHGPEDILSDDAGPDEAPNGEEPFPDNLTVDETDTEMREAEEGFSIVAGELQYGEDATNLTGNLDRIFDPVYIADGTRLSLGKDYSVSYLFFTDEQRALEVNAGDFDGTEGENVAKLEAGTHVWVVADAVMADGTGVLAYTDLVISKRKVIVRCDMDGSVRVDGRDLPEDGEYAVDLAKADHAVVSIVSADDEADVVDSDGAVDGSIVYDVSDVDTTKDGFQEVPVSLSFAPEFLTNYEPLGNIFGDLWIRKAQYYVTFTVNNNGRQLERTYELERKSSKKLSDYDFYDELMSDVREFLKGGDTSPEAILVGWSIYIDGFNTADENMYEKYGSFYYDAPVYVEADGITYTKDYSNTKEEFFVSGDADQHFVAHISKPAAENMYVSVIPSVYYDGRAHVAVATKAKVKKENADLRIGVYHSSSLSAGNQLRPGVDYTLTYKNNVNASMKLIREGEDGAAGSYVRTWSSEKDRPTVTITGKGTYKGFSADVYFDILPMNLGAFENANEFVNDNSPSSPDNYNNGNIYTCIKSDAAASTGFKTSYLLKDGKVVSMTKQNVTKTIYSASYFRYSTVNKWDKTQLKLVQGKDYDLEIYKMNKGDVDWSETGRWVDTGLNDPSKITEAGQYLCLLRGKGNFCGAVYETWSGSANTEWANYFNSTSTGSGFGTANPWPDENDKYQFIVTDDNSRDLSLCKVTIGKKSIPYDGEEHEYYDFKITVKDKNGKKLEMGKDYDVQFFEQYDHNRGDDFGYAVKPLTANNYAIRICPWNNNDFFGEYYIDYNKGVKIQGLKLASKYFKLTDKKVPMGTTAGWEITPAGQATKLNMSDYKDPYYVAAGLSYSGSYGTASKLTYMIGGSNRCGEGIDPSTVVKLTWSHTLIPLKDAIAKGLINIEVADQGYFHVKGAVPEYIDLTGKTSQKTHCTPSGSSGYNALYPGCKVYVRVDENMGYEYLTLTFKNNKKLGGDATVTVKANGRIFKGSVTLDKKFKIAVREVNDLSYNNAYGSVYAVVTDSLRSKGSLAKPDVTLQQAYRDTKGFKWVKLDKKYYRIEKGDDVGESGCATKVLVKNGTAEGFNFAADLMTPEYYALYNAKIKPADVTSVTIDGKTYDVSKGVIKGYSHVFTGSNVRPYISSMTVKGQELNGNDYYLGYGSNITEGKTTGVIGVILRYNKSDDRYPFGGIVQLKFEITKAPNITM